VDHFGGSVKFAFVNNIVRSRTETVERSKQIALLPTNSSKSSPKFPKFPPRSPHLNDDNASFGVRRVGNRTGPHADKKQKGEDGCGLGIALDARRRTLYNLHFPPLKKTCWAVAQSLP